MSKTPEEIAAERKRSRESLIQPAERVALELQRIADTLESMRLELVEARQASADVRGVGANQRSRAGR